MIRTKKKEEIDILREGGARNAYILDEVAKLVKPGVSTKVLDDKARELILEGGDTASFLGYKPYGAKRPYPAAICVSVNEEVVHGIPNEKPRILEDGDVVTLDLGLTHKGLITDHAITVFAGKGSPEAQKLLATAEQALMAGIKTIKPGVRVGDISAAIEAIGRKHGYGIITTLAGHGVGYSVHEDPYVPNVGRANTGVALKEGTVIAIEPMFTLGSDDVVLEADGYTYTTIDRSLAVHVEHTVVVTSRGVEILTR